MKKIFYSAIMLTGLSMNVNAQNWLTTGNAGLPSSSFLGTTDGVPLSFKVNNKAAGKIDYVSSKANTSFGYLAMKSNTAAGNSAFGYQSMPANTSGFANTAMGQYSLNLNVDGNSNTALGSEALRQNVSGFFNTSVGQASLAGSKGNDNTAVGRYALISLATGSGNTAIGSGANLNDSTLSNVTLLGFLATGTSSNSVQIGNSSVTSVKAGNNIVIVSDGRFKKNIKQNVPGLTFINALSPVTYNYDIQGLDKFKGATVQIENADSKTVSDEVSRQYKDAVSKKEKVIYSGFVAQDVEKVAEKLGYDFSGVYKPQNDKDPYGLSYAEFVVPLVKAVQELSKINDELQKQNTDLEKRVKQIEAMTNAQAAASSSPSSNAVAVKISPASLQQNIPNPFTHSTSINYTLPQQYSSAKIIITDNAGRSLKEIKLSGSGKGSVMADASTMVSGTYHYSLYVDGKMIESKQMVLAK